MSATTTDRLARITHWLAAADPDPEHAHRWWSAQHLALLPVGRMWDAVKVDAARGEHALAQGITGPVIADQDTLYFLVPPGTADRWESLDGVEALGTTCYLTVPSPDRTTPPGVHWRVLPDPHGTLVRPTPLSEALARTHVPELPAPPAHRRGGARDAR